MAQLHSKTFDDWEDYIRDKFPGELFLISPNTYPTPSRTITVVARDKTSQTQILFDFPTDGLCRVCFYHPESPLHNADNDKERQRSLMYEEYEISDENLHNTDEYLNIPLCYGWTERAFYYKGELVKSDIRYFDGEAWQTIPLEDKSSWLSKVGCLGILIAWPVLLVQDILARQRLNSSNQHTQIKESQIPPILLNQNSPRQPG